MPPKRPCAQLGGIDEAPGDYRAHLHVRNEWGHDEQLYGPHRRVKHRADADLASIRAAAEGWSSKDDEVKAMRAETRRLQRQAEFESRVASGMDQYEAQRQAHTVIDSDRSGQCRQMPGQLAGPQLAPFK